MKGYRRQRTRSRLQVMGLMCLGWTWSSVAWAAKLDIAITSGGTSTITATPGSAVAYEVIGILTDNANEGLAGFVFDLTFSGGALSPVSASPGVANFAPPLGATNPAGYGGTPDGNRLRQVGGVQNTFKNTGASAPFPVGTVVTGIGHTSVVLATGSLVVPAGAGVHVLSTKNVIAGVIRQGETGASAYWATEPAGIGIITDLTVTAQPNVPTAGVGDDVCTGGANDGGSCATNEDCPAGVCGNKSRYITITPPVVVSRGLPASLSIQVTIAFMPLAPARVGEVWWAGMSQSVDNTPNPALTGARVLCESTPSNAEVWPVGNLHLFGEPIVPGSSYEVRMCDATGSTCSDPLLVATGKWGDILSPFGGGSQPNFSDISAVVAKFQEAVSAPAMPRADLLGPGAPGVPNTPDQVANFVDISADVGAFQGVAYPFTVPACP